MARPNARQDARPEIRPENRSFRAPKKRTVDDYLVWFLILAVVILVALVSTFFILKHGDSDKPNDQAGVGDGGSVSAGVGVPNDETTALEWAVVPSNPKAFIPQSSSSTAAIDSSKLYSSAAIMVDLESGKVISQLNPDTVIYPASLTKIMTVIVACENIEDMYAADFKLTNSIADELYREGASQAYFVLNRNIPYIDLIYGAILPSGADACIGICETIAKSESEFVKMMNEKAKQIGCERTNFTNATGLHDQNHYSTVRDMANILSYAMNNPFIRRVLSAKTYESSTPIRSESGSNKLSCIWAGRLLGNEAEKATMFAAKTGYTPEANQCLASVSRTADGKEYVIVTVGAKSDDGSSSKSLPYKDAKYLIDTYID